jgi:hypothetical protein
MKSHRLHLLLVSLVLLSACSGRPTPWLDVTVTASPLPSTATASPSATLAPATSSPVPVSPAPTTPPALTATATLSLSPTPSKIASRQLTPSVTPTPPATSAMAADESTAAPCSIDWSVPVNAENQRAILACYKQLYPFNPALGTFTDANGNPAPPLCPPAFSPWEAMFNTSVCWSINHGTPAALTATSQALTTTPTPTPTLAAYP